MSVPLNLNKEEYHKPRLFWLDLRLFPRGCSPHSLALIVGLLFAPFLRAADSVLPAETTADRYQYIWLHSPFVESTASVDQKSTGSWILIGMAGSDSDPMVLLQNRETKEKLTVTQNPNDKGFTVLSMLFQDDLSKSLARIHTPTEDLVVKYDLAFMAANAPAITAAPPVSPPPPSNSFFHAGSASPVLNGFPPSGANVPRATHAFNVPPPPPAPPVKK